jgi:hypothetical protein
VLAEAIEDLQTRVAALEDARVGAAAKPKAETAKASAA